VKTPDHQEKSLRRYVAEQAIVGFVIGRVFYCLCPLSGALLGAATAISHVIREKHILEKLPDPFKDPLLKIHDTMNKTALLATGFFTSILCISLLTAPPLSFFKAAVVMGYVHSMGEETVNKIQELFLNAYAKMKFT
jgi:hypothetical protein